MKKLLVIHNSYREFGGEDANIVEECNILKEYFDVKCLNFHNSEKLKFKDLISFLTNNNINSNKKLIEQIKKHKPDVAYVHNTWFKANLGILSVLKDNKIPYIIKIHNFRYSCTKTFISSRHLKGDDICYMCGYSSKGIFNKYFKESYLKSVAVNLYGSRYIKILQSKPSKILVLNNFHKNHLVNNHIDDKKVEILHNPIVNKNQNIYDVNSDYVVYSGRITDEKGVINLLESWVSANLKNLTFIVLGDGPDLAELKFKFGRYSSIKFLGNIDNKKAIQLIKQSRANLTATKMYEGQPRIFSEASQFGVPTIYPSFGGMDEFFPQGYPLKFNQFDYSDLNSKILELNNSKLLLKCSDEVFNFSNSILGKEKYIKRFTSIFSELVNE